MALFNQSTTPSATAVQQIADSAGASADAEMIARAGLSLKAAFQHFNNFANWEFALVEAPTILVTAPFAVTGATASAGSNTLQNLAAGHGVLVDDFVTGPMFAAAGRVTATAASSVSFVETFNASLISSAASAYTVTATRDFYDLPTAWKQPYDVRLLNAQYTLRPIGRRMYDRSVTSEFSPAGSPIYYDIFGIGQKGKIRLLRPPAQTDRLQLRYYRRMDSTVTPLDIPGEFEPYLVAWATWHFLMNKADSMDRANTWLQFANEGFKNMLKMSVANADDDVVMQPGHYNYNLTLGANSVRPLLDEYP